MKTQLIDPKPETIGGQAHAFEVLADIARTFPDLPSAYAISYQEGDRVSLQITTGDGFEAWRTALGIPPLNVVLTRYGQETGGFVAAESEWAGTAVRLTCHDVVLPAEPQPEDEPVSGLPAAWSAQVAQPDTVAGAFGAVMRGLR